MGATGALIALTGLSAGSQLLTSSAQASALKQQGAYERQIAETNSRLATIQAEDAIKRGEDDVKKLQRQTRMLKGSQRAALAAQGLDLTEGDALAIQEETAALGAEDVFNRRNNAWREGWGLRVQAQDLASRGRFAEITAKNQARNTILTGGLNAAKSIAGGYYTFKTGKTAGLYS